MAIVTLPKSQTIHHLVAAENEQCEGGIPAGLVWLLSVLIASYTLTSSQHGRTVSVRLSLTCGHLCPGHGKFGRGSV